jgi:hypothetical protein
MPFFEAATRALTMRCSGTRRQPRRTPGKWKLVSRYPGNWELYDLDRDRTELRDHGCARAQAVQEMITAYDVGRALRRIGLSKFRKSGG